MAHLLDLKFSVTKVYDAPNEKLFDKVVRFEASSPDNEVSFLLDVHSELCPVALGDLLHVVLTPELEGGGEDGQYRPGMGKDLIKRLNASYVMCGKVFKVEAGDNLDSRVVFISFGGLIMRISGSTVILSDETFLMEMDVYLLIARRRRGRAR